MYLCIYVFIYLFIYVCIYVFIYLFIYYIYIYLFVHSFIYIYIYIYMIIYVCIFSFSKSQEILSVQVSKDCLLFCESYSVKYSLSIIHETCIILHVSYVSFSRKQDHFAGCILLSAPP